MSIHPLSNPPSPDEIETIVKAAVAPFNAAILLAYPARGPGMDIDDVGDSCPCMECRKP